MSQISYGDSEHIDDLEGNKISDVPEEVEEVAVTEDTTDVTDDDTDDEPDFSLLDELTQF